MNGDVVGRLVGLTMTAAIALALVVTSQAAGTSRAAPAGMVAIPTGSYVPLYALRSSKADVPVQPPRARRVRVAAFDMDAHAVTNAEYLDFVRAHPEWQRSRVRSLFADASYLRHWRGDLDLGDNAPASAPVVYVSWFAARAYLKSLGKDLPTIDQWEYVAAASETRRDASRDTAFLERVRRWYGRPADARLSPVGSVFRNAYGVSDMHGLVWEWTLDFNSALVTGESRADSSLNRTLYCGNGTIGASDFEDYAAFMRFAFRSSLNANYTVGSLGFRGVAPRRQSAR